MEKFEKQTCNGESLIKNGNKKNNTSYSIRETLKYQRSQHRLAKKAYMVCRRIFSDIIRRGALLKKASIHTAKMTAIKITLKKIQKREDKR